MCQVKYHEYDVQWHIVWLFFTAYGLVIEKQSGNDIEIFLRIGIHNEKLHGITGFSGSVKGFPCV